MSQKRAGNACRGRASDLCLWWCRRYRWLHGAPEEVPHADEEGALRPAVWRGRRRRRESSRRRRVFSRFVDLHRVILREVLSPRERGWTSVDRTSTRGAVHCSKQSCLVCFGAAGPHPDTDSALEPKPVEGEGEQAKKRRGRKKSKLEDMFPGYLQVRLPAPQSRVSTWQVRPDHRLRCPVPFMTFSSPHTTPDACRRLFSARP